MLYRLEIGARLPPSEIDRRVPLFLLLRQNTLFLKGLNPISSPTSPPDDGTRFPLSFIRTFSLLLQALVLLPAASRTMSIAAPGEQATFINTALTEDFHSLSIGNRMTTCAGTIGVYPLTTASALAILVANQFGGFMCIGAQSGTAGSVFLQLNADYDCFGFWRSAGTLKNGLSL